jgi:cyclomaltodextrinase
MNYIFRNAVLDYAAGGKAAELVSQFEAMREAYPPQAFNALMNLVSSHDQARAVHVLGWQSRNDDAAKVTLAKQRLKLATFIQMTTPGAPSIYYGDEVGLDGGDDPYNRATFPWTDQGGQPDMTLHAEFKRLIALRHRHAVLRRGSFGAPVHVDDAVVVHVRRLGKVSAITAFNNSESARRVTVRLPAALKGAVFTDGLTGRRLRVGDGAVELTVPAVFGSVLVGR